MTTPSKPIQRIPDFDVPATCAAPSLSDQERKTKIDRIVALLEERDAKVVAHYYTDPDLQRLADASGGFVGDSLAMARFGRETSATTLMVAGVRFMGESAKILSPEKRILMPTLEATCSLDLGCPIETFGPFCDQHPDREVVVYCNTSAAVKARADWVVTSSNALAIVDHLDAQGKKILFGPDRHLGAYIKKQTGADMLLWQGACVVHEEFQAQALLALKAAHPEAAVLAHPESPESVLLAADVVGSTTQILEAAKTMEQNTFIVATDRGLFYKMQQAAPTKTLIEAPTAGFGATCRSCGHCPWMAMNALDNLEQSLQSDANEILLDSELIDKAKRPLQRMVDFKL